MKRFLPLIGVLLHAGCGISPMAPSQVELPPKGGGGGQEVDHNLQNLDPIGGVEPVVVDWLRWSGWHLVNNTSSPQTFLAYITSFDDQRTPIGVVGPVRIQPGGQFDGSFNRACTQLDLTRGNGGEEPFAYAFFDAQGKEFNPHESAKVEECRRQVAPPPTPAPTPFPTPSPSPSPTPPCHHHK